MSSSSSSSNGGKCRQISLEEIIKATDDFNKSNVIGEGGEGEVYLAKMKLGPDSIITHVVVKRLKKASEQFGVEIKAMSKIDHHPNLVSLLCYCDQPGKEMLVYEYVENGSLAHYLKKKSSISMSWQLRVSICLDAARGLSHLHAGKPEYSKGIIHRDVKPDNILLDKNSVAKVSDFGMLKLSTSAQKQSEMRTQLKGTSGYYAPEYLARRTVTRMIDVYAFGVMLYEVLCLESPWEIEKDEEYFFTGDENFGLFARQHVDPTIKDEITEDALEKYTNIIGKSMKTNPRERPTMDSVVSSLVEVALSLKSKEDEYETKQGEAATEPNSDHSTGDSYHRGESSEEGKTSEAIVVDVGGEIAKAEVADYVNPKAVSQSHPTKFGLDELLRATDNFNDENVFVRGDFALTYEGLLDDGRTVAVKRYYFDSLSSGDEYQNKISLLSKHQSDHIVSIIGICEDIESEEVMLVHEFMKNRTLGYHLLQKESTLSWDQRLRICIDAAKGLEYLHHGISNTKRISHKDVSPFTILLNEQWGAKLSDFGFPRPETVHYFDIRHPNAAIKEKGNMKYSDPHYNMTAIFTRKSDVYSFGIVLFDVLFGMEYLTGGIGSADDRKNKLAEWTGRSLNNDSLDMIDERLKGQISLECFKEIVEVATSCAHFNLYKRPHMAIVVKKLESALKISQQTQPS